jgi:RNA polymerase sigma-70 factor (ECF subfamily)
MEEKNLKQFSPGDSGGTGADDVLLSLIGEGDEAALARLYREKSRFLYSLVFSIVKNSADAEEVIEEVFLKIWQNAGSYDGSRGSVMAWLTTITRRQAIDRTRSKQYRSRMKEVDLEAGAVDGDGEAMVGADADTTSSGAEAREVAEAIDRLGDSHRQLIRLSYFEGLSHSMIAESLDMPLGTVKTRLREAVIQLRNMFEVKV